MRMLERMKMRSEEAVPTLKVTTLKETQRVPHAERKTTIGYGIMQSRASYARDIFVDSYVIAKEKAADYDTRWPQTSSSSWCTMSSSRSTANDRHD
jgi:hypothetical protein